MENGTGTVTLWQVETWPVTIDKIDAWQVFWSILLVLISYISIMITLFRKDLQELKGEIDKRETIENCKDYRKQCEEDCVRSRAERAKYLHAHATIGTAGEVVK